VLAVRPDAIVHQATALAGLSDFKNFDRSFAQTNRLRVEGTDALLAAAREAGVRRFVAQSYAGWPSAREGGPVKTEEDPLDPTPVPAMSETLAGIRHLEQAVVDAGGVALRYGGFYGSPDDAQLELVRKRRFPIVGGGGGIWSFVHLEDATTATVLALEAASRGSTTSSTTSPRPCGSGCPRWRQPSGRSRPGASRGRLPGSWRASPASSS
jgi:nucleoside-diphosphate-sugar epimerase